MINEINPSNSKITIKFPPLDINKNFSQHSSFNDCLHNIIQEKKINKLLSFQNFISNETKTTTSENFEIAYNIMSDKRKFILLENDYTLFFLNNYFIRSIKQQLFLLTPNNECKKLLEFEDIYQVFIFKIYKNTFMVTKDFTMHLFEFIPKGEKVENILNIYDNNFFIFEALQFNKNICILITNKGISFFNWRKNKIIRTINLKLNKRYDYIKSILIDISILVGICYKEIFIYNFNNDNLYEYLCSVEINYVNNIFKIIRNYIAVLNYFHCFIFQVNSNRLKFIKYYNMNNTINDKNGKLLINSYNNDLFNDNKVFLYQIISKIKNQEKSIGFKFDGNIISERYSSYIYKSISTLMKYKDLSYEEIRYNDKYSNNKKLFGNNNNSNNLFCDNKNSNSLFGKNNNSNSLFGNNNSNGLFGNNNNSNSLFGNNNNSNSLFGNNNNSNGLFGNNNSIGLFGNNNSNGLFDNNNNNSNSSFVNNNNSNSLFDNNNNSNSLFGNNNNSNVIFGNNNSNGLFGNINSNSLFGKNNNSNSLFGNNNNPNSLFGNNQPKNNNNKQNLNDNNSLFGNNIINTINQKSEGISGNINNNNSLFENNNLNNNNNLNSSLDNKNSSLIEKNNNNNNTNSNSLFENKNGSLFGNKVEDNNSFLFKNENNA